MINATLDLHFGILHFELALHSVQPIKYRIGSLFVVIAVLHSAFTAMHCALPPPQITKIEYDPIHTAKRKCRTNDTECSTNILLHSKYMKKNGKYTRKSGENTGNLGSRCSRHETHKVSLRDARPDIHVKRQTRRKPSCLEPLCECDAAVITHCERRGAHAWHENM